MGGPSREAYLRAQAAERARVAAMRTRDGVVDLAEWRDAQQKARALHEFLGEPPWLLEVRVAENETEWLELRVVTTRELEPAERPGIRAFDYLPVRYVSRNPRRPSRDHGGSR